MSENIGIFGGSFDPVHKGHEKLAEYMISALELKKLIIIPAAMSPFKSTGSSPSDRLNMCREAFPGDRYEVSDIEICRGGTSYTVDTVSELKKLYPADRLFLMIGSDQLFSFTRWRRWQDILSGVTLCAVSRERKTDTAALKSFAERELMPYGEVKTLCFEPFEISSTEIRRLAASGEDISPFVGEGVAKYITSRGLYSGLQ